MTGYGRDGPHQSRGRFVLNQSDFGRIRHLGGNAHSKPTLTIMASDFPPTTSELYETFEDLQDWDERYEYILELGRELPEFPESLRLECNKVHGCMSTVWMVVRPVDSTTANGRGIEILADSDSMIVKGLIAVLLSIFDHKSPVAVINEDPSDVFGRLGLDQHLSPNRRNGLFAMVQRIKEQAVQIESSFQSAGG